MWWYLADLSRFRSEQAGIEQLATEADWLHPVGWRTDESKRLIYDADIKVGAHIFSVYLRYPEHFPFTPPSVFPRNDDTRWSSHQFGPGGELCLEYGPDTWTSDLTGADLLRSAQRLLSSENPADGPAETVASRHDLSLGQVLRTKHLRLLLTRQLKGMLSAMPAGATASGNLIIRFRAESSAYTIDKITNSKGEMWQCPDIPAGLARETFERKVPIVRLADDVDLPSTKTVDGFRNAVAALGIAGDQSTIVLLKDDRICGYLVGAEDVFPFTTIEPEAESVRLDPAHQVLLDKSVTIVGCGSLGSKIGTSLARAGVANFYLVDDDLLLPDNMVRNDLDWRDVGSHKCEALAQRIYNVNPSAKVYFRQMRLAGQEASASAENALTSLVNRDLVVDATANPQAFNLLAAIAEGRGKPMVWAEVYGGGFGGMIARHRPAVEPTPQLMRRAVENWFKERGYQPQRRGRDYATGGEGPPMIADDADVSSIAAAATRLTIDTLIGRDPSYFPASVYVIGLAPEPGLFTQAFETYPIEMPPPPAEVAKPKLEGEEAKAAFEELVRIFETQ